MGGVGGSKDSPKIPDRGKVTSDIPVFPLKVAQLCVCVCMHEVCVCVCMHVLCVCECMWCVCACCVCVCMRCVCVCMHEVCVCVCVV